MRKMAIMLSLCLMFPMLSGCMNDDNEPLSDAPTAGSERWAMPESVQNAFVAKFPTAEVVTWNREVSDYGKVWYDILYRTPGGQTKKVAMTADGEIIPNRERRVEDTKDEL